MAETLQSLLQKLTFGIVVASIAKILISATVLYLSVKIVGGKAKFNKSLFLASVMELLDLFATPLILSYVSFPSLIVAALIYPIVWLVLVMMFFEISFFRAILVAVVQVIVSFVLVLIGLTALIAALLGAGLVVR